MGDYTHTPPNSICRTMFSSPNSFHQPSRFGKNSATAPIPAQIADYMAFGPWSEPLLAQTHNHLVSGSRNKNNLKLQSIFENIIVPHCCLLSTVYASLIYYCVCNSKWKNHWRKMGPKFAGKRWCIFNKFVTWCKMGKCTAILFQAATCIL